VQSRARRDSNAGIDGIAGIIESVSYRQAPATKGSNPTLSATNCLCVSHLIDRIFTPVPPSHQRLKRTEFAATTLAEVCHSVRVVVPKVSRSGDERPARSSNRHLLSFVRSFARLPSPRWTPLANALQPLIGLEVAVHRIRATLVRSGMHLSQSETQLRSLI
jgi:hypothetical protein